MEHVVIVGAGQAGASAAMALRRFGFEGRVTMIGAEAAAPYQRPPLSKAYLIGDLALERLFLRPAAFYDDQKIDLKLDLEATAIDPAASMVEAAGERIAYDHLILATGAAPRRLPASLTKGLKGTYVLRGVADADRMGPELKPGRRVLIVGGGYIGLEVAAVAAAKGVETVLVEAEDRILKRVASKETSDYFRALHTGRGVDMREGAGLAGLEGDGRVASATLSDGSTIDVDFVIEAIGVGPATGLAEAAGIAIENGVKVDAQGRTSVANVWAAGDCASFPYRGRRIRLESVPNASDQAEVVAKNILGESVDYVAKPWFWSDQYDVKLQIAGLGDGHDRVVARRDGAATSFWYYKGDELLAVDAMNDPRAYMIGKRLIEAGKSPSAEAVADTSVPVKSLL